jgi:RNase P subunit RPR2
MTANLNTLQRAVKYRGTLDIVCPECNVPPKAMVVGVDNCGGMVLLLTCPKCGGKGLVPDERAAQRAAKA